MTRLNSTGWKLAWLTACAALVFVFAGCKKGDHLPHSPKLKITTLATGLAGPMGIETDAHGNVWVSEGGTDTADEKGDTHNDNGKVILITPAGKKYDAIINLSSYANVHSNELQGTVHILRDGGTLYVLSGDYLYHADISHFEPGDKPIDANTLPSEDIAAVISQISSANNPEQDSHPYNLTKGPDGNLYIADAGANAIVKRSGANQYSILAEIPNFSNPTPVGGPVVQAVPTSIMWDGNNFLVTTLTGFPFIAGQATIYQVSKSGDVSVYEKGFTMLVDQAEGISSAHVVVQFASSFDPASGYAPESGSLVLVDGSTTQVLAEGLNQPVGIKQVNDNTWYVTSLGDGAVLKVTYQ